MAVSENKISINDLTDEDFNDPISLLDAIGRLNMQVISKQDKSSRQKLLSIADIQSKYGLSADYIKSSILAGAISPSRMDLYFTEEDVKRVAERSGLLNLLMAAFEKELDKMAMNYSYKPILLLSLLSHNDYRATVDEIIDYYFKYYNKRIQDGLSAEKSDSSFVRHPNDKLIARRTILRYPAGVLTKKAFIVYDKESDSIVLNPLLVKYNNHFSREYMIQRCYDLLEAYYSGLNI